MSAPYYNNLGERAEHAMRDRVVRDRVQPVRVAARRVAGRSGGGARGGAVQADAGDGAEQEDGEPGVVHPWPHCEGGRAAEEAPQGESGEGGDAPYVPLPHREGRPPRPRPSRPKRRRLDARLQLEGDLQEDRVDWEGSRGAGGGGAGGEDAAAADVCGVDGESRRRSADWRGGDDCAV